MRIARAEAMDNIRKLLAEHETSEGVLFGTAAWLHRSNPRDRLIPPESDGRPRRNRPVQERDHAATAAQRNQFKDGVRPRDTGTARAGRAVATVLWVSWRWRHGWARPPPSQRERSRGGPGRIAW